MPSVLQQIAQQFESIDSEKASELRRIDTVYTHYGLNDGASLVVDEADAAKADAANRLLRHLPRMARMRNFRLYRIGVGEQANGGYAHQAVALLDARHLPTPGNTLAVLDPADAAIASRSEPIDGTRQYSFQDWLSLQTCHGRGCALIADNRPTLARF